jgi:hypothetical protein
MLNDAAPFDVCQSHCFARLQADTWPDFPTSSQLRSGVVRGRFSLRSATFLARGVLSGDGTSLRIKQKWQTA